MAVTDGAKAHDSLYRWRDDPGVREFDDTQPLVVFDGDCVFCSRSMRLVARMDRRGRIRMTPAQGALGQSLYRHAALATDRFDTYLVLAEGRMFKRSDALVALAEQLPYPWRALRILAIVPRSLRDAAYGLLARHRYRLFGRREGCGLADPALARRLI
jgi:predicted DCC family thiol-disulfide oxidoreductase YuxK